LNGRLHRSCQEVLEAFHEPPLDAASWNEPDIELPETEPVKVIATGPTVPNLIALPCRVPLMLNILVGLENVILPLRFDPDCCQVMLMACVSTPMAFPDHVPERSAEAVGAGVLDDTAVVIVDDDVPVPEEPHAAIRMSSTTAIPLPSKGLHFTTLVPNRGRHSREILSLPDPQ
jgi:hypothetical protein